jgi:polysaccharide biosynthesis/export protein
MQREVALNIRALTSRSSLAVRPAPTLGFFFVCCVLAAAAARAQSVSAPAASPPAPPSSESSSTYIIGPGDTLQVFVWQNPDLSETVPVRPDGKISTPLVENMVAVGKTPSQLARDMEKVLSVYVRSPKVNIIVAKALGELTQVKIVGEVLKPQAIPFHEGMTVLDAILDAGGLSPYAAGNRAKLIRTENGKTEEIRVKLGNLLQKGDMSQNLRIMPGDVLLVPQSLF